MSDEINPEQIRRIEETSKQTKIIVFYDFWLFDFCIKLAAFAALLKYSTT